MFRNSRWMGRSCLATAAGLALTVMVALTLTAAARTGQAQTKPVLSLNVVGGLAAVNQYTRNEEPFWSKDLARLSGGRYTATISPQDRAGVRGTEVLGLVQSGALPFGTVLVNLNLAAVPELGALDLAGLNPDIAKLRSSVAALRPQLVNLLRQRLGVEALAIYTYPAQVLFCKKAFVGLRALKGLRIRTSGPTVSDFVEGLGALPVPTSFADIVENARVGNIDCAVTGAMSGNTIGLHEHTSHMRDIAITWGISMFVAHGDTWKALPADLRSLLEAELPRLEKRIWDEAERETGMGVQCNLGASSCTGGRKGGMRLVPNTSDDDALRAQIFSGTVLPRWLQRCGPQCDAAWVNAVNAAAGLGQAKR